MTNETTPAEPTAPRTKSNCLVAVGVTCLVIVIVGVLLLLWFVRMMTKNPTIRQAYSGARLVAECQLHLQNPNSPQNISAALDRFKTRNGRYPDKLDDLCPDFLDNRAILHCPADPRPKEVVSYEYYPPPMDAPGSAIVVECKRHVIVKGQPPMVLMLTKDGKVLRPNYTPSTGPAEPKPPSGD